MSLDHDIVIPCIPIDMHCSGAEITLFLMNIPVFGYKADIYTIFSHEQASKVTFNTFVLLTIFQMATS